MFNLEQAIAEWRRQMLAAGIKTPVPLEELESHLREDVERQMRSGLSAEQAFEIAVQEIGQPATLKNEFRKNEGTNMTRIVAILAAVFGTVFGGAMILPALGRWQRTGILHLGPILMGSALVVIAGGVVFYGIKTLRDARGRNLINIFIFAALAFYLMPLIQAFFNENVGWAQWTFCIALAAAALSFYGSCWARHRAALSPNC